MTDQVFQHDHEQSIQDYFTNNAGTAMSTLIEWGAFMIVARGACITQIIGVKSTLERTLTSAEMKLATLT